LISSSSARCPADAEGDNDAERRAEVWLAPLDDGSLKGLLAALGAESLPEQP
jgi:hypothetical protein